MDITIKIGSNVLTTTNGTLDKKRMESFARQIAQLHEEGHRVILVSSGAVAAGRSMIKGYEQMDTVSQRQLLSSIGQVKLIDTWKQIFDKHNISIGQLLVTKQDFSTREHYLNMKNCVQSLWENRVLPVVNENDTVSVTALMFTDNDELSGLMASMMDCQKLFILSNIDGIFNGNPNDPDAEVIREIKSGESVAQYVQTSKSSFGRGGMITKCRTAQKTADSGIDVYIANGTTEGIITSLTNDDHQSTRTHFQAGEHSPAIKKWIAYSDGFTKANVIVNEGASQVLCDHTKAASLLLAGVVRFEGEFKSGDLLTIINENGDKIGVGRSNYDRDKAQKAIDAMHTLGVKVAIKPLIHYDYLYIY
ncbi:MAG: glutamate 5-kinase [Marinilabiliaceae bacterium]|nr:glutamate 5-kinase [Marinilabiliaceae bacterium]